MTVTLSLAPKVEARVRLEANRQDIPVDNLLSDLVEKTFVSDLEAERKARALAALDTMLEIGDESEQRETFMFLQDAVDEDRLSDRKLFYGTVNVLN